MYFLRELYNQRVGRAVDTLNGTEFSDTWRKYDIYPVETPEGTAVFINCERGLSPNSNGLASLIRAKKLLGIFQLIEDINGWYDC